MDLSTSLITVGCIVIAILLLTSVWAKSSGFTGRPVAETIDVWDLNRVPTEQRKEDFLRWLDQFDSDLELFDNLEEIKVWLESVIQDPAAKDRVLADQNEIVADTSPADSGLDDGYEEQWSAYDSLVKKVQNSRKSDLKYIRGLIDQVRQMVNSRQRILRIDYNKIALFKRSTNNQMRTDYTKSEPLYGAMYV
jgi:hypothetical protein